MSLRRIERFIGETARPWVLILSALAGFIATVSVVWMGMDLSAGALFVAAAWAPAIALYGSKAVEETRKTAHKVEAEAKIAEVNK